MGLAKKKSKDDSREILIDRKELMSYYEKEIVPTFASLEKFRTKYVRSGAIALSSLIIGVVGFILYDQQILFPGSDIVLSLNGAGLISTIFVYNLFYYLKSKLEASDQMKEKIVRKIIKKMNKDFEYYPDESVDESMFVQSKIFPETDEFDGDDFISGRIGSSEFNFSEVHANNIEEYCDQNNRRSERDIPVFDGIFLHAKINFNFNGETVILPNNFKTKVSSLMSDFLGRSSICSENNKFVTNNTNFDERFVVFCTDVNESKAVLSENILNTILKLHSNLSRKESCFISFTEHGLNIAFETSDIFEVSGRGDIFDIGDIEKIFNLLDIVQNVSIEFENE
ncbi:DUF3137 domain-containing protein [Bacteriovoracaceae bacterium]|nr:DUF3137 domain-containing protein [Bacteriovoracaceae bacterium]